MKYKSKSPNNVVQELCRKLKIQLEQLNIEAPTEQEDSENVEEQARRSKLMEQLKRQLADLSR
jgi:hypothetical protein